MSASGLAAAREEGEEEKVREEVRAFGKRERRHTLSGLGRRPRREGGAEGRSEGQVGELWCMESGAWAPASRGQGDGGGLAEGLAGREAGQGEERECW